MRLPPRPQSIELVPVEPVRINGHHFDDPHLQPLTFQRGQVRTFFV
jgi:hypothetical protein